MIHSYLLIMLDTVTKTFTTLHPTTIHFTTPVVTSLYLILTSPNYISLYLSTLHFLSFKLHPTTLHLSSLQFILF
jgi:hypothetical protein